MPKGQEEEVYDDELLEEEQPVEESGGFFDSLSDNFGAAPWWMISGAFHVLVVLLTILISLAIMRAKNNDTIVTVSLEQSKPPEYDEIKPREIFKNTKVVDSNMPEVEDPVVVHEEVVENHMETENEMDTETARGDENAVSDIPLGGVGSVAAIGLGGGGGGAFGQRSGGGRRRAVMAGGGGKATESAVDAALKWLAEHQEPDGRWDTQKYESGAKTDTACSALALLAFLGAGHTEKVGKYKDNVQRAVKWLISVQQENGCVYAAGDGGTSGPGYAHSIAGMALAEAAGMARVPTTIVAAQKAIDYSCKIHAEKKGGGGEYDGGGPWRYQAGQAADTSVTGWFVMQLKSAKVSGLNVPAGSFDAAIKYLDTVEKRKGAADDPYAASTYWYMPSRELGHGGSHHRLSAIGNLSRQFLGWKKEDLQASVENFVKDGGVPDWGKCDLYYFYYGTLCVFQQGGDLWNRWNEAMKSALLPNQRRGGDEDGSWDPVGHFAESWGRVGQTALCCLCLEVYYRYLPMYK